MADKSLPELIQEHITTGDLKLPVFNPVAVQLQEALSDPEVTIETIESLIMRDQALTSQTLRVANSSFYRGLNTITTIRGAVIRLGAQQVVNLATAIAQQSSYETKHQSLVSHAQGLWHNAFACALGCQWLAQHSGYPEQSTMAFLAGLLHDIGQLAILKTVEELVSRDPKLLAMAMAVLDEVLSSELHCRFGADLMSSWNLPERYRNVVLQHHDTPDDDDDELLIMVRMVDQVCQKVGIGCAPTPELDLAASREAMTLNLSEIQLAELEILMEDSIQLTMGGASEAA